MGAMDKDADMVFVFGGTNDFGHGNAEIGKKGDTDPYTFYGGMENLTNYLLSTYGKEKVCFLLPLRRAVEERADGRTLLDYVEVIKEVLIEKGIDYLDFYDNGLPKPISTQPDEYFADGLHPNDAGHDWVAEQVANYLKNK
jgi:lysophospholipase L1-like esterase